MLEDQKEINKEEVKEEDIQIELDFPQIKTNSRNNPKNNNKEKDQVFEDANDIIFDNDNDNVYTSGRNSMGQDTNNIAFENEVTSPFKIDDFFPIEPLQNVSLIIQIEEPLSKDYASNNYWRLEPPCNIKDLSYD